MTLLEKFLLVSLLLVLSVTALQAQVVRLAGSSIPNEGRLEVYHNRAWGTICDDFFNDVDATVACKSLGSGFVGKVLGNRYGRGTGQIWLDDLRCTGSETFIGNCNHRGWGGHNCGHSEDVSIACYSNLPADVRLVGGISPYEGRLEVYYNNTWGTVCDDYFDNIDATVACKNLGSGFVGQTLRSRYGAGTGQIWLDNLHCTGAETFIGNCRHNGWGIHNCGHHEDVSIRCTSTLLTTTTGRPTTTTTRTTTTVRTRRSTTTTTTTTMTPIVSPPSSGRVRLSGSTFPNEGRLEVYYNGIWGTVCDDSFGDVDATVACKSLGSGLVGETLHNRYGAGTGQIWLDDLRCTGAETFIGNCRHRGWGIHNCGHYEDVSIRCTSMLLSSTPTVAPLSTPPPSRRVRLAGSGLSYEGRLEVYYNGIWGTVCDDYFDDVDATIACKSLGFRFTGRTLRNRYGPGTGQIWLDNLHCTGSETDIVNCGHNGWGSHNCRHYEDVSITCHSGWANVRLADSGLPYEGRLEVYHNGSWGTVCNNFFDNVEATVACKSLGSGLRRYFSLLKS